jgi:hypothetical protein
VRLKFYLASLLIAAHTSTSTASENLHKKDCRVAKGFIYILGNAAMTGLLKVGYSTKVPDLRAKELASTGVPYAFKVSYYCLVQGANLIEKEVHKRLSHYRYSERREFFEIGLPKAVQTIQSICEPEHEWSDEILLRSRNGTPLNLEELTQIHGIKIVSRRQVPSQVEEMINFCNEAYEGGLHDFISSLVYCSNSDCCSFEFSVDIEGVDEIAREIQAVARKTIGQFDWFGSIDHGAPSDKYFEELQ